MTLERLGVNVLYLVPGQVGGSEVYADELLAAIHRLEPALELVVYCSPEATEQFRATTWGAQATIRPAPGPSRVKPIRAGLEQTWLPVRARLDRVQLLHSLGTTAPLFGTVPSVVTVLDLIFHHVPSSFPPLHRAGLELIVPRAARRAAAVIAISEFGRGDIASELGIAAEAISVTPLAAASDSADASAAASGEAARHRLGLGAAEVVLCVSAALPHKNLERLIDAFAGLDADRNAMLVLVGHGGPARDALAARAVSDGIADRVRVTGWIEREELEALYRLARVFAYPSLIEGFGIPVLEAMERGVAVACSNAPALAEVGGQAVEYFDPRDTAAMTVAIGRLLADDERRAVLIALGHERAAQFSWEHCAAATLAVYERALAGRWGRGGTAGRRGGGAAR